MKITDEGMAKMLGLDIREVDGVLWRFEANGSSSTFCLPKFTTSIDAITDEIESRGLYYELIKGKLAYYAKVWSPGGRAKQKAQAPTGPVALCAALAYLKEPR